jgi:hypothetical protein
MMACALVAVCALLAACSGTTGPAGPAGSSTASSSGSQGSPSGGGTALNISAATAITGTITSVAISGPPVVQFELVDQTGAPVQGLPAATWVRDRAAGSGPERLGESVEFLHLRHGHTRRPARPASRPAPRRLRRRRRSRAPPAALFVDHGDGTYQYTFAKDITKDPNVVYDATLTHRVGFEIRGLAQANNGAYTFQPSTGATTGIFSREIVDTATCDTCHTQLTAHGGARVEVQYCVMCHNPGTTDPNSGNTLDMKVMIHKIHTGNTLPSIQTATGPDTTPTLGQGYWIVGYTATRCRTSIPCCTRRTRATAQTCHVQNHPNLTEAANFKSVPTMEACGACHDNVNFATGANHGSGIIANDTQCATCHGPSSTIDNGQLQVVAAHVIPEVVAATKFQYLVNSVTFTTGHRPGVSGGEFLGGRSDQQQCAVRHPHCRRLRRHRSGHRPPGVRQWRHRAPCHRHRLGDQRLHQLGQRCDRRHLGSAVFPQPAGGGRCAAAVPPSAIADPTRMAPSR